MKSGNPVVYRYLDLYRAARLLVTIGNMVKVLGIVLGIGILVLCLLAGLAGSKQTSTLGPAQSEQFSAFLFGSFVAGALFGAFVGGIVFLLGILISAQGQILQAQADSAVHTSPFMNQEEKSQAMSLPSPRAVELDGGPDPALSHKVSAQRSTGPRQKTAIDDVNAIIDRIDRY